MSRLYQEDVDRSLDRAVTVRDLREMLGGLDDDAKVFFVCDYGDYHHTQQALPVEDVTEHNSAYLKGSGYSQSHVEFYDKDGAGYDGELDEDDEDDQVQVPIVVLR